MKIILFELNEVPYKVIHHFCKLYPESVLARILPQSRKYETYSEDKGHLSPWITWPTLHRGVTNEKHFISDFGQDLNDQEKEYPSIWNLLADNGVKVGVFGSLHSYPPPARMDKFSFFVPDTFAAGSECFPKSLESFQHFNLTMARESGRVVDSRIPTREALHFLTRLPELGFRFRTAADIVGQLVEEKLNRWKVVRRRTYQSVIGFEIFFKQLQTRQPDFVTFFTNHVASSLHRYWAATFPEDYDNLSLGREWMETYNKEIVFTMKKADAMLGRLVKFIDKHPEYSLWISSSMGQHAVEAREIETDFVVKDGRAFMNMFSLGDGNFELKPSMIPQFNVQVKSFVEKEFEEKLQTLRINGEGIHYRKRGEGFYSIDIGIPNLDESAIQVTLMDQLIPLEKTGMQNLKIQDRCGATAYHIPEGTLIIYSPQAPQRDQGLSAVPTTSIAPSILKNYAVKVPAYMQGAIS